MHTAYTHTQIRPPSWRSLIVFRTRIKVAAAVFPLNFFIGQNLIRPKREGTHTRTYTHGYTPSHTHLYEIDSTVSSLLLRLCTLFGKRFQMQILLAQGNVLAGSFRFAQCMQIKINSICCKPSKSGNHFQFFVSLLARSTTSHPTSLPASCSACLYLSLPTAAHTFSTVPQYFT